MKRLLLFASFAALALTGVAVAQSVGNYTRYPSTGGSGGITQLTGDVTAGPGSGSEAATVALVGGSTAAAVNTATIAANAATNASTASTIVKRDASKNFLANRIGLGGIAAPLGPLHTFANVTVGDGVTVNNDLAGANSLMLNNNAGTPLGFTDGLTFAIYRSYIASREDSTSQTAPGFTFDADRQTGLFDISGSHVLGLTTGGTEAMRVDGSQNVAIGTTTAVQKLTVAGLIKMAVQGGGSTPACGATTNGSLAFTSAHLLCVCDGSGFVKVADGTTACVF